MTNEQFMICVDEAFGRSKKVLIKKEVEYSKDRDRLEQFHRAGQVQGINPAAALVGMATKHYTPICDMAKDPTSYTKKQWHEKLVDLRNYTFLLEALIEDLGVV